METRITKKSISTDEFYRLITTNNKIELSILIDSDLTNIKFKERSDLCNKDFSNSIFDRAYLLHYRLYNCKFVNASLQKTELSYSRLEYTDFTNTDFTQANLVGSIIDHCVLKKY